MNKSFAQFADKYALWDLHKKHSKEFQFYNSSTEPLSLNEKDSFYRAPKLPQITFEQQKFEGDYLIGKFHFDSDIKDNGACNKYASGLYYKVKPSSDINIIIVHGWRTSLKIVNDIFLNSLMRKKYNIYYLTLPFHFERNTPAAYNGEHMISANIDRTLLSIKQAVSDARALISYLKSQNNSKVILIGVSLGGFITNLVSTVEKQHDALISVLYANSIAHSVWITKTGKYIKRDFEAHGFTYEQLKRFWAIFNPSNFKPVIPKEKILLMSGLYDQYIWLEDTNCLWSAWEEPQRILYPCGHSGLVFLKDKIAFDSNMFIEKMIQTRG